MFRKIRRLLAALAITGAVAFQTSTCDVAADAFMEGFEIGYEGTSGGGSYYDDYSDDYSYDYSYGDVWEYDSYADEWL